MSTAAQQLSQWIENTHPDFFSYLYSQVAQRRMSAQAGQTRLRGFGDDGSDLTEFVPTFDNSSDALTEFTPDIPSVTDSGFNLDTTSAISDQYSPAEFDIPTLTSGDLAAPSSVTSQLAPQPSALDVATDNSGSSFLSEVGSGISSAASSVGNFLTSSQGLSDVTKLATAYFGLQNNKVNAQVQTQVLQAQLARSAGGLSPAPITYAIGANGQLVPIYSASSTAGLPPALQAALAGGTSQYVTTPSGVSGYTVPTNMVSALTGGMSLSQLLPWILLIAGGLILAKELGR